MLQRYAGDAEGVGVSKVLLGGEGYLAQVVQALDVPRLQSYFLEPLAVELRVHAMPYRFLQTLQLEGFYLLAGHCLDFGIEVFATVIPRNALVFHFLCFMCWFGFLQMLSTCSAVHASVSSV